MRQAELVPREHVARTLDGLLRGPEFTRERTLWDEIRDWLAAHFDLDDVLSFGELFRALALALLVSAAVVAFVSAVRARRAREAAREGERARRRGALERARELLEDARRARGEARARDALQRALLALFVASDHRGDLEFRRTWTTRELIRRGRPSPRVQELLGRLVEEYEPMEFGRVPIDGRDLDRLEALVESELERAGEVPA